MVAGAPEARATDGRAAVVVEPDASAAVVFVVELDASSAAAKATRAMCDGERDGDGDAERGE